MRYALRCYKRDMTHGYSGAPLNLARPILGARALRTAKSCLLNVKHIPAGSCGLTMEATSRCKSCR